MLQRKRKLKKEKTQYKIKLAFSTLIFLLAILIMFEYINTHFSLGRSMYLSPLAGNILSSQSYLEEDLVKSGISFSTLSSGSDGSFRLVLKDGGEVILSSKKDIKSQISSLQLILSRLTIEGKKLKSLDFRFDNPVVAF